MAMRRLIAILLAGAAILSAARPGAAVDKRLRWDKKWGPLVPHAKFPKNCSLCHVPKRWDVIRNDFRFDHFKETGYPLEGAHADAACLRCHNDRGPLKAYLSRGCAGCHVDPHKGTLGLNCTRCHDQQTWARQGFQGQKIAEHARTRFPLTGMHASIQCQQCHVRADAGEFAGAPIDCYSCHQRDYQGAPNHVAQSYSQQCQNCHATTSFVGATFNHAQLGPNPTCINCHQANYNSAKATPASNHVSCAFPTACQDCHNTMAFGPGTPMQHSFVSGAACYACHQADFQGAPNHVSMNFSTQCQTCHSGTATWLGALFDHTPLGPNPVCYNCHSVEYAGARTTPASSHAGNGFPTTCQNCHTYAAWGPGTAMQHSFVGGAGAACQTCHMGDYNGATSPVNHIAQGIPASSCNTCHATFVSWLGSFTHSPSACYNTTSFASHQGATCAQCHPGGVYATASCAACHGANNMGTTCQ